MLQCGGPCNPAMDAIDSIERSGKRLSSGKALTSLEVFMIGGHFMHDSCRLMFSNKKLKRDRRNVRWINASHSLHPY